MRKDQLPDFDLRDILGVINMSKDSVVIFDCKWNYLYVNDTGWKVLQMPKEKVIGKNVWKLLPHLKGTEFEKAAKKSKRTMKPVEIVEYYPHRRMWGLVKFFPSKKIVMVQIADVTELMHEKQINDQLLGDLNLAMEIYWSDRNREFRKKTVLTSRFIYWLPVSKYVN